MGPTGKYYPQVVPGVRGGRARRAAYRFTASPSALRRAIDDRIDCEGPWCVLSGTHTRCWLWPSQALLAFVSCTGRARLSRRSSSPRISPAIGPLRQITADDASIPLGTATTNITVQAKEVPAERGMRCGLGAAGWPPAWRSSERWAPSPKQRRWHVHRHLQVEGRGQTPVTATKRRRSRLGHDHGEQRGRSSSRRARLPITSGLTT